MIILIFLGLCILGALGIGLYLHFSKKKEVYDPEHAQTMRDAEIKQAEQDFISRRNMHM